MSVNENNNIENNVNGIEAPFSWLAHFKTLPNGLKSQNSAYVFGARRGRRAERAVPATRRDGSRDPSLTQSDDDARREKREEQKRE